MYNELEETTNKFKRRLAIFTAILVIGLIGVFANNIFIHNGLLELLCFILAIGGAGGSAYTYFQFKRETGDKQEQLIQEKANEIIPGARCDKDSGFTKETLMASDLEARRGNIYRSNFLISGEYEHVKFDAADIYYANQTSSGKSSHTTVLFDGILMIFDFENKFDEKIKIFEKNSFWRRGLLTSRDGAYGMEKMETESILFEEKFESYSTDEQIFYKVVTPVVIELILEIEKDYPGLVSYSFRDGKCYVALSSKEASYELRLKDGFTKSVERIEKNIILIKEIIEGFGLSGNTFTSFESRYQKISEIAEERKKEREKLLEELNTWG